MKNINLLSKICLLALFLFCTNELYARKIGPLETYEAARVFANSSQALRDGMQIELIGISTVSIDSNNVFYVARFAPIGYAVFSPESRITPILAYSFVSNFSFADCAENILLSMIRGDLKRRLGCIESTAPEIVFANENLWAQLLNDEKDKLQVKNDTATTFGPFIDTRWGQSTPYNNLAPIDPGTGERSVSGCTATAMAQIINYWEYPGSVQFDTTESYYSDYTEPHIWIDAPSASMDTIIYNAPFTCDPPVEMLEGLMFACGVSVHASYSSAATGAHFSAEIFLNKWRYTTALDMRPDDAFFYETLRENMRTGHPSEMAIYNDDYTSGHAIVVDGWRTTGEFHLNLGWDGYMDTWYFLPDGMPSDFSIVSFAVVNIEAPLRADAPEGIVAAPLMVFDTLSQTLSDAIHVPLDTDCFAFDAVTESTYVITTIGPPNMSAQIFTFIDDTVAVMLTATRESENRIDMIFKPPLNGTFFIKFSGTTQGNYSITYYKVSGPRITAIFPNAGDILLENTAINLRWIRGGLPSFGRVRIELSLTGIEGPWETVCDSVPNPVSYRWVPPDVDVTMNDVYVRFLCGEYPDVCAYAGPFTIATTSNIEETEQITTNPLALLIKPLGQNTQRIEITSGAASFCLLTISDLTGRCIAQFSAHEKRAYFDWNTSDLPDGVFLFTLANRAQVIKSKYLLIK